MLQRIREFGSSFADLLQHCRLHLWGNGWEWERWHTFRFNHPEQDAFPGEFNFGGKIAEDGVWRYTWERRGVPRPRYP